MKFNKYHKKFVTASAAFLMKLLYMLERMIIQIYKRNDDEIIREKRLPDVTAQR